MFVFVVYFFVWVFCVFVLFVCCCWGIVFFGGGGSSGLLTENRLTAPSNFVLFFVRQAFLTDESHLLCTVNVVPLVLIFPRHYYAVLISI